MQPAFKLLNISDLIVEGPIETHLNFVGLISLQVLRV